MPVQLASRDQHAFAIFEIDRIFNDHLIHAAVLAFFNFLQDGDVSFPFGCDQYLVRVMIMQPCLCAIMEGYEISLKLLLLVF